MAKNGSIRSKATKKRRPAHGRKRARSASSGLITTAKAVGRTVGGASAAIAKRIPWRTGDGDAIDLLETDHRRLEDLLKSGEETTGRAVKRRTEILMTITIELTAHELIEEKVLYPVLKSHPDAKDIVLEGYQEHHVADVVLKELHGLRPSDERWGAKFKVFKENIEHHIEEEEGEMFKTARSVLSRRQLERLGARMQTMKAKALASKRSSRRS
jgi:hemerythrin-like domain-containing protein